MRAVQGDRDRQRASDPQTPHAQLVDLAARRFDLHLVIDANPAASPELRAWIALVRTQLHEGNRAGYAALRRQGPPMRKRSRLRGKPGGVLAGCGCLAAVIIVLVLLGGGGLGLFS